MKCPFGLCEKKEFQTPLPLKSLLRWCPEQHQLVTEQPRQQGQRGAGGPGAGGAYPAASQYPRARTRSSTLVPQRIGIVHQRALVEPAIV